MSGEFQKIYTSLTDYKIWEVENGRFVNETAYVPYLEWKAAGNQPSVVSGDRFIVIVDGLPTEDPNKATVLAKEEYDRTHPVPTIHEQVAAIRAILIEQELI